MKLKDIQTLYENDLLNERAKDCFIYLLKKYGREWDTDIEDKEFKKW